MDDHAAAVWRLTGRGRSAVAVLGLSGPAAGELLAKCWRGTLPSGDRVRYGHWTGTGGDGLGESVVVSRAVDGTFEICCHGGVAAIDTIIGDLVAAGAREVAAPQVSSLLIAEADAVLQRCPTPVTAAIALAQVRGALAKWVVAIRGKGKQSGEISKQAAEIFDRWRWARFLTQPPSVVLAGPPNVGKSSLINRLIGHRRVLTDAIAGTTRDAIDCDTVLGGWPVRLTDTAGLHASEDAIEREGIERAMQKLRDADLILWVGESNESPSRGASAPGVAINHPPPAPGADAPRLDPLAVRPQGARDGGSERVGTPGADAPRLDPLALRPRGTLDGGSERVGAPGADAPRLDRPLAVRPRGTLDGVPERVGAPGADAPRLDPLALRPRGTLDGVPERVGTPGADAPRLDRPLAVRARGTLDGGSERVGTPGADAPRLVHKPSLQVINKVDPQTYSGPAIATRANPDAEDLNDRTWTLAQDTADGITALGNAIVAALFPPSPTGSLPVPVNQRQASLLRQIAQTDEPELQTDLLHQLIDPPRD